MISTRKKLNIALLTLAIILTFVVLYGVRCWATTMYVTSNNGLRLRSEFNTKSEILAVLPYRTEVEPSAKVVVGFECWYKVNYDGKNGYLFGDYLTENLDEIEESNGDKQYLGNWQITAYTHTGSPCANGNYPTAGHTVACNDLPFGTRIYIEGIGERVVEDRGPSGFNGWCDVFMDSYSECVAWGSQVRAVYIIGG